MCKSVISETGKVSVKYYFCSCEHMVDGMPAEYRDYATLINKLGKDAFKK